MVFKRTQLLRRAVVDGYGGEVLNNLFRVFSFTGSRFTTVAVSVTVSHTEMRKNSRDQNTLIFSLVQHVAERKVSDGEYVRFRIVARLVFV